MNDLDKLAAEIFVRLTVERIRDGASSPASLDKDAESAYGAASAFMKILMAKGPR